MTPADPQDASLAGFSGLVARLERRLAEPLPGLPAQLLMAPKPRRMRPPPGIDLDRPIPAAVVALIFPAGKGELTVAGPARLGEPCLVLTQRTAHVAAHKGEICLPGGTIEPEESALDAALRETEEEIGIRRADVRVIGRLTPVVIPVSGYRIEPFVAATERHPDFRAHAHEVDSLIEVPLARLLDPDLRRERSGVRDGEPIVIPYFEIAGSHVWGATAMILAELCHLVEAPAS